jgi:eukaryotic-like serine/threonine-protein kinase
LSQPEPAGAAARHRQVSELFLAVCELDTQARTALLDLRCSSDPGLRAAVELLVARDRAASGQPLLRTAAPAAAGEAVPDARESDGAATLVGLRVGSYRLVRLLGSGGMGAVYEAEQDNPRRSVALKLMRPGVLGRETLKRFESESRLMARLRHPGIAQVFEAGTYTPPGAPPGSLPEPFFAMEYVEHARSLTDHCADQQLPVRARLELFAGICDAVHHGHTKGVIHRDLKPGNILVDGTGRPRIIDFGIARAIASDMAAATISTAVGQFVGTLNYMSPEQCAGDPDAVDTRSDVYALGVVLYEMLTARLPYELGTRSLVEAPRIIREQAPARPSAIDRALRGDVETIVLKALEKDRERRYASAGEFAADIRRFLRDEPIAARPASRIYQARMFTRRHKGLVFGLAAAFVGLGLGLAAALRQASRAGTAESEARAALAESQLQNYVANIAAADGALRADDGATALARLEAAPEALRGWEWWYLLARADRSSRTLSPPDRPLTGLAVAPDGRQMLVYQEPAEMSLVDIASGATIWSRSDLYGFTRSFSRDGKFVVCHQGNELVIIEALSGRELARFSAMSGGALIERTCFHPDGRRIATADNLGHVVVWDWREARKTLELSAESWMMDIEFSPDGTGLAYSTPSAVCVVETDSGRLLHECPIPEELRSEETRAVRFSPDGSLLAASHGTIIQVWDLRSGELRSTIRSHTQRIFDLAFDPTGTLLASGSADRTVRLWDLANDRPLDTLLGHIDIVPIVGFCLAGSRLVTFSEDRTIKFWDVPAASPIRTVPVPDGVIWFIAFTADGRGLFCAAGSIGKILDLATLGTVTALNSGTTAHADSHFALSRDGRFVVGDNFQNGLTLYDSATGDRMWSIPDAGRTDSIAFTTDGLQVASSVNNEISIMDTATGALLRRIRTPGESNYEIGFRPGTESIVSVSSDGPVQLWDATTGELQRTLADASLHGLCLAFSRDGSLLAIGTDVGTVAILETASWNRIAQLTGMQPQVWSLAFSPDGARVAAGSKNGVVHVWDTRSWHDLLQLRGHVGTVRSLCWSPDGRELGSGGYDRTLTLWKAPGCAPRSRPDGSAGLQPPEDPDSYTRPARAR